LRDGVAWSMGASFLAGARRRWLGELVGALLEALVAFTEAIGLAPEEQDVGMVGKSVEERGGEAGIPKHLDPAGEVQVRGEEQAAPFVALGAELEQQGSARTQTQV